MITPFAEAMGFDAVIATTYETKDGRYTGRLYEGFVWGTGKLKAVREWAEAEGIDLDDCHACSDSVFDTPLLASVGSPHAVNPDPSLTLIATARRWPIEYWDRPPGVPSVLGLEPYHLLRPFVRPSSFPYRASTSPASIASRRRGRCCWPPTIGATSTWRHSPSWPPGWAARCASWAKRRSSTPRSSARSPGPSGVSRSTGAAGRTGHCGRPKRHCGRARWSSCCRRAPSRGESFFSPILKGKTGTARLAAATGAVVVPIGLWGTEKVWARSARMPDFTLVRHPPRVSITVGHPLVLSGTDAKADTAAIMAAISTLLPEESWARHEPTAEELARTKPPS